MSENKTKLRVKLGAAEIEYEGNEDFLKSEVMPQISKMLEMVEARADLQKPAQALLVRHENDDAAEVQSSTLTTSTIARILEADSASELAIAALARLTIIGGASSATRQQILDEMKTAPLFFKQSYVNNHSHTMKVIQKSDRVRHVGTDSYSLSNKERKELDQKLRDGGDEN